MKPVPSRQSRLRHRRRGSALLLVMWLIIMLSMIIYSTVRVVAHDMDLTIAQKKAFRARQLAEMGLNIASNYVVKESDFALLNQTVADGESFSVRIRGEGGAFNINRLLQNQDRDVLERLFELWGLDKDSASHLVDRMIDWVDGDDQTMLHGMERDDYEAMGVFGYPFNRPFYSLDEMLLVPGFDMVVANLPDWRDYFTIYSTGGLDLNAAEPKVIAAAIVASKPSRDPLADYEEAMEEAVEFVQNVRWGQDGIENTEDDSPVQDLTSALSMLGIDVSDPMVTQRFTLNDPTTRIESVATVNDYRKRVVLIVRNRTQNTPQILAREEVPLF